MAQSNSVPAVKYSSGKSFLKEINNHKFAYLLVMPTLLYLLFFQLYPLIESVRLSLTDLSLTNPNSIGFVGLKNYIDLFFKAVHKELEEAAYVDGSSKFNTFFCIILPMTLPGLVSIIIYSFIVSWNDYQYALILTNSVSAKTVQIGIAEMMDSMGKQNWGGIMASGVIITIPIIALFGFIQRYLIQGLTAGAVKG